MNAKRLTAAMATTALVLSVPLITVCAGAAAAGGRSPTPSAIQLAARASATSRVSGLPFGGAALDGPPKPESISAQQIFSAVRAARAAATSRLSGLAFGGAALQARGEATSPAW